MNPRDLLKTIEDIRKDKDLTKDILQMLAILKDASDKTAAECKDDADLQKGFKSLDEALSVSSTYMEKGKLPLSVKFGLAMKYKEMSKNLQHLGAVLEDPNHPLSKKFTENVTSAKGFDTCIGRIWAKADGKMLKIIPTDDGGMDVFELLSGQDMRICQLDADKCQRIKKDLPAINDLLADKKDKPAVPPKKKFG